MYYSISLFSTVAYGDIIPKNPYENVKLLGFVGLCYVFVVFGYYWRCYHYLVDDHVLQKGEIYVVCHSVSVFLSRKKVKYLYFHLLLEYHNEGIDINIPVVTRYIIYHLSYTQKRKPGLQNLTT